MSSIVLNSGGFDSIVLMNELRETFPDEKIYSLFFNYGQNTYQHEKKCARKVSDKLGCEFIEIELPNMNWTSNDFYGDTFKDAKSQYVEMRNLIFLSYALSLAESVKAEDIYVAFLKSSHGYKDTSPLFVEKLNSLSDDILGVTINAPFIAHDKDKFYDLAFKHDIKEDDFHSCDVAGENGEPCGECPDCVLLEKIMEHVNKKSPIRSWVKTFNPENTEFQDQVRQSEIKEARLLINNSCQLDCHHCFYDFKDSICEDLSFEEYCKVIDSLLKEGIKKFHFSGKEPLLDDTIFRYAEYINSKDKDASFDVVTNGINVPKYANELKKHGFIQVFLSVDDVLDTNGFRPTNHVTDKALESLIERDIPVIIFIDLHENNYNRVDDIVQYLYNNYGIQEFQVRTICLVGNAKNIEPLTTEQLNETFVDIKELTDHNKDIKVNLNLNVKYTYNALDSRHSNIMLENIKYVLSVANPWVSDNFFFYPEAFCGRYNHQITVTPDGFVLGCGSEVGSKDYDRISSGNVRYNSMSNLIKMGKEKSIKANLGELDSNGNLKYHNCTHIYE